METSVVKLVCDQMRQKLTLELSNRPPNASSLDLSACPAVFEDGWYEIEFHIPVDDSLVIDSGIFNVNGYKKGTVNFSQNGSVYIGRAQLDSEISNQPFLLLYDLVILSVSLFCNDGTSVELFSSFLLCVSKNPEDSENINNMLSSLADFDNGQITEWLFSDTKKDTVSALHEGTWYHKAYKSLSSYIQLLEDIIICYKSNYLYFKAKGRHIIAKDSTLMPFSKVRVVSTDSFHWLMQNTGQLAEVSQPSGISYMSKHYIPLYLQSDIKKKSWNTYENQVVVGFLRSTLIKARAIYSEFNNDIVNEQNIIDKINGNVPKEYQAPIVTIKTLQISFCRILLDRLSDSLGNLQTLYDQYSLLFDVRDAVISTLPRKTKAFQEINPYSQVFEVILRWFQYGEFNLAKDRLILQVKTLDKLFEYYCLYRVLDLLVSNGFQAASISKPAYKYEYIISDGLYENEREVANTYILQKDNVTVSVYYQPVISATRFENGIQAFRTTKPYGKPDYYTPDFIIKFNNSNGAEEYIFFDAKFSSLNNIRKHHLSEVIQKYSVETAIASASTAPKMVWVLQGRITSSDSVIWRYHNAPLAMRYLPKTSYGIVAVNTKSDVNSRIWDEITRNIPWLK